MRSNSDLEDEIGVGPLRTSRTKLDPNSDLEDEITSDLEDEIGIPRTKLRIAQDEIGISQDEIEILQEEIEMHFRARIPPER